MQVREKVGKSRFTVFFPMIWGSGGSKNNLAKAAGAEPAISKSKCIKHFTFGPLLEVEMSKKCTLSRREPHFQVKNVKN